jgi:uncharacterized protein YjgD (DUF1641 family)
MKELQDMKELQEISKLVSDIFNQFNTLKDILKEPNKDKVQVFINNLQDLLYRYVEITVELRNKGYVIK